MGASRRPVGEVARKYYVEGIVQGVGFRFFVVGQARRIGLRGYVKNLADGRVEVYAIGQPEQLKQLEDALWQGPPAAVVRSVQRHEAPLLEYSGFGIEY